MSRQTPPGRRADSLDWGVATLALPGEAASGDSHLVHAFDGGVLVAVVDALGHGPEAAASAQTAVATLQRYAHEPPPSLIQRCHMALIGMRGAVASLASFNTRDRVMTWFGVGDVEGVLLFADSMTRPKSTSLVTRGGIVGSALPPSRPWVIPVSPGDMLIFATDGIKLGFDEGIPMTAQPQQIADSILAKYRKGTDDALVLAARYCAGEATP